MGVWAPTRSPPRGAAMVGDGAVEPSGSYLPGGWVALAGSQSWVLVDADASGALVSELWPCVRRGSGPVAVAETLARRCDGEEPSFGLVEETETGLVIALSGRAVAEVSIGGSQERLDCPAFARSLEYRLARAPAAVRIFSTDGRATGARLPLRAGVVQANEMLIEWEAVTPTDTPRPESVPRWEPLEGEAAGTAGERQEAAERRSATTLPAVSLAGLWRDEAPAEAGLVVETGLVVEAEPDGPQGIYDHLFGHTVQRAVEDAAIRLGESEAAPPAHGPAEVAPPAAPRSITESQVEPAAAVPAGAAVARARIIDATPWGGFATEREGPPPPPEPEATTEAVELTISRAEQLAIMRQMESPEAAVPGPTVHAVHCPAEHPNPAHADVCRVCGAPIADQSPVTVCRPSLGVLRMSTGDLIPLDRGVILGRSPAAERPVGGEGPHLVKLPSPGNDISRRHLELSLDGWHVLVTDLNSTNGTLVTRPGREPERLRPDQPTLIEPGTLVTLADEASFLFEATT